MSSTYANFLKAYYGVKEILQEEPLEEPKKIEIKQEISEIQKPILKEIITRNQEVKENSQNPKITEQIVQKSINTQCIKELDNKENKKEVAIFCGGRLGNILFELATGIYYANSINAKYYVVNENISNVKKEYLRNINIIFPTLINDIKIVEKDDFQKVKNTYKILIERQLEKPLEKPNNDLIYIDGYRECPVYWNNDKNFIFNTFKDDINAIEKIKQIYNIDFSKYVAINIRRGDYLKQEVSKMLGNLSLEYFKKCINQFENNQKFLIVSDDIEWCKTQFIGDNFIFADKEVGGCQKMVVDFWIQTLCHDNIIGNSTFSWWAAYLNKTPNRKVYAPKQFFKTQGGTSKIPKNDNWILMDSIWDNNNYEYSIALDTSVNTIISNKNKKVVFTCISGNVDKTKFKDPLFVSPGFDYICYVDDPDNWKNVKGWKLRKIPDDLKGLEETKRNRAIKINPHKYFSEYDLSVYVDGNVLLKGDLNTLLESILDNQHSVYIPKHPSRNCIYKEAKVCTGWKDSAQNINPQIEQFRKDGFPENYGLTQNNIIIRKHNDSNCIKLMEYWWNIVLNGSKRDQLSLFYAKWKTIIDIKILDTKLNNSEYFNWQGTH